MAPPPPLALPPLLPSELLSTILTHQKFPTTLIICSPRASFPSSILLSLPTPSPPDPTSAHLAPLHPLLIPTLQQTSISRHITTVFVPTLSHLRAYLSVFPGAGSAASGPPVPVPEFERPGRRAPLLVVFGVVGLHRDTSEWSAQGLGRTLAGVVEAGRRAGRGVWVVEEKGVGGEGGDDWGEDVDVDWDGDRGGDGEGEEGTGEGMELEEEGRSAGADEVWKEKMPMLSGGSRRGVDGDDGEAWTGRTVEVGTVMGRYFRFVKEGEIF